MAGQPGICVSKVVAEVAETWPLRSVANPVTGELVVEVAGQLRQLTDLSGHLVAARRVVPASASHREVFDVQPQGAGLLLLQVVSGGQRRTVNVLKE